MSLACSVPSVQKRRAIYTNLVSDFPHTRHERHTTRRNTNVQNWMVLTLPDLFCLRGEKKKTKPIPPIPKRVFLHLESFVSRDLFNTYTTVVVVLLRSTCSRLLFTWYLLGVKNLSPQDSRCKNMNGHLYCCSEMGEPQRYINLGLREDDQTLSFWKIVKKHPNIPHDCPSSVSFKDLQK